ncbi:hypothetical protein NE237_004917 [Protea cynaroides]|uniref:Protein MIZU-KUSSEI 1 n=1 Tax=Protea cynaroides TaxID=273540 RepID=A0A9Q0QTZ4_9MAGN|nr:hypothetical protein NE237_004917 [Protea cynaroides]
MQKSKARDLKKPRSLSLPASPLTMPSPLHSPISLQQPSNRRKPSKPGQLYSKPQDGLVHGGSRLTGTLYGCRKARATLAIQENQRCLPLLILELGIPTGKLLQDMGSGLMRIALECEKRTAEKAEVLEEPLWTMYCNGRKVGYGLKKEPTDEDFNVMQLLHAVSMGAGVLPTVKTDASDGELTYMRAYFERVIGSKDSETFYMMNPDGNSGPELTIFFVRV